MSVNDSSRLKGLCSGVVLSTFFDKEVGTIHNRTLYSPGVRGIWSDLHQWVHWVISLHTCRAGQRVYTALACNQMESGLEDKIELMAFCGSSLLHAAQPSHLLQGLGLAHDFALATDPSWAWLLMRVQKSTSSFEDFASQKYFFDQELAAKCEAARKVIKMKRSM